MCKLTVKNAAKMINKKTIFKKLSNMKVKKKKVM